MLQKDFDKEFLEIFLKYSLEGLPKKVLITDGYSAYPTNNRKNMHKSPTLHIPHHKKTNAQPHLEK